MKTILVASSKGGVGKTTVATHLAAQAALAGQRTVLVDADPQASSTRWAERRAGLDSAVLPLDGTAARAGASRFPTTPSASSSMPPAGAMAERPGCRSWSAPTRWWCRCCPRRWTSKPPCASSTPSPSIRACAAASCASGLVGNKLKPWTNASQQAIELLQAMAVPAGRAAARQPGLRGAGRARAEPVRLPLRAGARAPGRLATAAELAEESALTHPRRQRGASHHCRKARLLLRHHIQPARGANLPCAN